MKQDKQDRRSQRTHRLVNSAMMELLFEKHYDTITVQDILDRAGIGRSTFYTHYFDKEDVLTSIAEQMLETFGQQFSQRNAEQGIVPGLELFQHVQQNQQYFQAMLRGHAGEVLWEAAQTALSRTIEQNSDNHHCEKTSSVNSSGCDLSVSGWLLSSPAEMVAQSRDAIYPGTNGEHIPATGFAWGVEHHRGKERIDPRW